jgi:uncharacterized protein (TIGR04255 family)
MRGKRRQIRVQRQRERQMPVTRLPTKLKKEPLFDAVFELRFGTANPYPSTAIASILYAHELSSSGKPPQIERLQNSEIPTAVRIADPNLKYLPLLRARIDNFNLLIGDSAILIGIRLPYAGWENFKPIIIRTVNAILKSNVIVRIERYSMKYADMIEGEGNDQNLKRVNLNLSIGDHKIASEQTMVRVELRRSEFIDIIQIVSEAKINIENVGTKSGLLIDVDSIVEYHTDKLTLFMEELPDRLDRLHTENKYMFFQSLTEETIAFLEPIYGT